VRPWLLTLAVIALGCGRTPLVHYSFDAGAVAPPVVVMPPVDAGCTATAVDAYTIPPMERRPIDVLFVIDDSCSMADDQRQLSANMRAFFSTFQAGQVDFHVGVVTTDVFDPMRSGRLVAPFLTQGTPEVTTAFQAMVMVGTGGSGDERGLTAEHLALRPPLSTTVNAGFVRPEADFALVFLTDEDDGGRQTISFLVNSLKTLKPDGAAITLGCQGTENWRYAQFARSFGERGLITRCTQSYATTLRTIAGRVLNKRCIVGLRAPLDASRQITVTFNGSPTSWVEAPPEDAYPNGSIEVEPCPESGGQLELTWSACN
jgi:hypothetical protein